VIIGTVLSDRGHAEAVTLPGGQVAFGPGQTEYTVAVEALIKGTAGGRMSVWTSGSGPSCGAQFDLGTRYKFYLDTSGAQYQTGSCSGNRQASDEEVEQAGGTLTTAVPSPSTTMSLPPATRASPTTTAKPVTKTTGKPVPATTTTVVPVTTAAPITTTVASITTAPFTPTTTSGPQGAAAGAVTLHDEGGGGSSVPVGAVAAGGAALAAGIVTAGVISRRRRLQALDRDDGSRS
jgi:hypothetical protein